MKTVVNESDALHCEERHPWLDLTTLVTLSGTAEQRAQVNTDVNGVSDQD